MVSQPLNADRGRRSPPVYPKNAALSFRGNRRPPAALSSLAGAVNSSRPQPLPLKSAHPPGQAPGWQEHLVRWKQISTGMAVVSGLAVLSLYSWTVQTQSRWSQRYQVWQQMQRNERQFLLTQESIANSLREIAERSEMVPLVPERMIEVPIAPVGPDPAQEQSPAEAEVAPLFYPVGY